MMLSKLFHSIEKTLLAKFEESGFIKHNGDKGENREEILINFLKEHLPKRYGVTKGEIITRSGQHSHAIDIIIYDAINCPVLYAGKTSIIPIEGVYGIIEVKSSLSKAEFTDAATKIKNFKELAPRELGIISIYDHITLHRASRPFGIIFAGKLADNSLDSLKENWREQSKEVYNVNFYCNMITVLGIGILRYEKVNFSTGEKHLLLDTDEFVDFILTQRKRINNNESRDEMCCRIINEDVGSQTFGRFFTYLLTMLGKMRLNTPDIGQYIDTELPITIFRG